MTSMDQFSVSLPDGTAPNGGGGSLQRMLVPVGAPGGSAAALALAARACAAVNGTLRVVHVRIFDPPIRSCGRYYPESGEQAAAVIDQALTGVWPLGIKASGVVIDAQRSLLAQAIAAAARDSGPASSS